MSELWDLYDQDFQPTGRTHRRGDPLQDGDYHLVVQLWIQNSRGDYLIQKRSPQKSVFPGLWDCSAQGSAVAGDNSLSAVLREAEEELGLHLLPSELHLLIEGRRYPNCFIDVYFCRLDVSLSELRLQAEEVDEVRYATKDEILAMAAQHVFVPKDYFDILFAP